MSLVWLMQAKKNFAVHIGLPFNEVWLRYFPSWWSAVAPGFLPSILILSKMRVGYTRKRTYNVYKVTSSRSEDSSRVVCVLFPKEKAICRHPASYFQLFKSSGMSFPLDCAMGRMHERTAPFYKPQSRSSSKFMLAGRTQAQPPSPLEEKFNGVQSFLRWGLPSFCGRYRRPVRHACVAVGF